MTVKNFFFFVVVGLTNLCERAVSRGVHRLGRWTSLLFAVYLGLSSWGLLYRYAWMQLIKSQQSGVFAPIKPNVPGGVVVLVFFALLRINWVGSWFLGMFYTHFRDRKWRSVHRNQMIAQASKNRKAGDLHAWEPTMRPRMCVKCDRESSDRVYHDKSSGRCLPVLDHFCEWVRIAVYLRTMKAYLYVLALLPVDLFVTSILIVVTPTTSLLGRAHTPIAAVVALFVLLLAFGSAKWSWKQWKHLAFQNETLMEYRHKPRRTLLAFKFTFGGQHFAYFHKFEGNPWDLGKTENIRQVLGSKRWMWLLFFWQPERVAKYGRYNPAFDLPFSDKVCELRGALIGPATEAWEKASRPVRPRITKALTRRQNRRSAHTSSSDHGGGSSVRKRGAPESASEAALPPPEGKGPATEPKGKGPATEPKGKGPATEPKGKGPAPQAKGEGPATEPKGKGPVPQAKGKGPATEPKEKVPVPQAKGKGPATEPKGKGPAPQAKGKGPATEPKGKGPVPQAKGKGPAPEPKEKVPVPEPQKKDLLPKGRNKMLIVD